MSSERMTGMTNTENPDDLVWIRASAESAYAGIPTVVEYTSYPRAEWDALTNAQREEEIDALAANALESIASYGAEVVDASDVPDEHKQ